MENQSIIIKDYKERKILMEDFEWMWKKHIKAVLGVAFIIAVILALSLAVNHRIIEEYVVSTKLYIDINGKETAKTAYNYDIVNLAKSHDMLDEIANEFPGENYLSLSSKLLASYEGASVLYFSATDSERDAAKELLRIWVDKVEETVLKLDGIDGVAFFDENLDESYYSSDDSEFKKVKVLYFIKCFGIFFSLIFVSQLAVLGIVVILKDDIRREGEIKEYLGLDVVHNYDEKKHQMVEVADSLETIRFNGLPVLIRVEKGQTTFAEIIMLLSELKRSEITVFGAIWSSGNERSQKDRD